MRARREQGGHCTQRGRRSPLRHLAELILLLLAAAVLTACGHAAYRRWLLYSYPLTYEDSVRQYAQEYEVDPLLLWSFIRTESGFDPKAKSGVGARGLMQITEDTFVWIKTKIAPNEEITFDDLYDPAVNIRFGAYYVSASLTRYHGHVGTAAAAYHSGWGTVDRLLAQSEYSADGETLMTFPYTQMNNYVSKIAKCYEKYQTLYAAD